MKTHRIVLLMVALILMITSMVSAATAAKVQFFNGNLATSTNTLYLNFNLVNTGTDPIALSNVKMRYYFTNDGTQSDSFACDWSPVGSANVTGTFVAITPVTGADRYFEVGFASAAGTLAAGASTEARIRVWKSDWSNFDQSNDYSFNPSATSYADWNKVPVYISGTLYWGTPAGGSVVVTPTPVRTATPIMTATPIRTATALRTPTTRVATPTPTRTATPIITPIPTSGPSIVDGYATGTTGGAGGTVVTVTNATDLKTYASASGSYIINVSGNMGDIGDIKVSSNKTIQGVGTTARITGEFSVDGTSNVIFKNLTITHPGSAGAGNGIDILNGARYVFITKCYFYDVADECIGVTKQADYVTVSWCKFDYPSQVDHNFSVLVGSDDALTSDMGKLHVTFHHNWWSTGSDERMPSVRFGTVHVYNNYYNAPNNGYCVRVRLYSQVLVQNNYFENVKNPIEYYNTTGTNGKCKATGNVFVNTTGTNTGTDSVFTPPYGYSMDTGSNVKNIVMANAGNK